jgi:hypothetical protein
MIDWSAKFDDPQSLETAEILNRFAEEFRTPDPAAWQALIGGTGRC